MRFRPTEALLATGALLALLICAGGTPAAVTDTEAASATEAGDVSIQIDAHGSGPAVNPRMLGSNVQWVYGGDNLLTANTIDFDPAMLRLVEAMGPRLLRYPGGDQSDLYDWRKGIGPLESRGTNLHAVTHLKEITYMGSGEVLALGARVGAEALFTVNVVLGTAADAAAWVRQTNVTRLHDARGELLPKVPLWEIGNEPYLPNPDGTHPDTCQVEPATYAARINAFVPAMRAVDPTIKIGIALANDRQNGIQVVSPGCRGFAAKVLAGLTERVDFVSIHDAYLPYDPSGRDHPASEEYVAAMASTQTVQADLTAMRALLQQYPKFRSLPFAVTEYNALFNLRAGSAYLHSMASPMGALYVADLLRLLANRDDILMANSWSLTANDHWGAIHAATANGGPYARPDFEVFRLFGVALNGVRLSATVRSPTFDAPDLGFSAAAHGLAVVTTLVTMVTPTSGRQTMQVLVINKDYLATHLAAIEVANAGIANAHISMLTAHHVLETDDLPGSFERTDSDLAVAKLAALPLPPHSVTLLTLTLEPSVP